jgi:hypothetical protein
LIVGLANGSISGVSGVVRLSVHDHASNVLSSASLEAGDPLPHHVRLVRLELPSGRDWEGLHLKADLLVKGMFHPIRWACRELLNADGSLTLKRNQYI